jgi:hypothetical protein
MKTLSHRSASVAALLACLLAVSGCGTGSKNLTSPVVSDLTQSEANDVAVQTSFALDQLGLDVEGAGSSLVTGPALRPGAPPSRAAWDTTIAFNGMTAEISRNFYDAGQHLLAGYGPTAVRMNWRSHIWGAVESTRDTAAIEHHSNLDFTGIQLADTALTLDGTCADTLLNRFQSLDSLVTRYGYWRSTLTAAAILMRKADGRPLSGSLTYVAKVDKLRSSAQGDVEKHLSAVVVITFDGTQFPEVVINGVHHFQWDMQHGTMIPV